MSRKRIRSKIRSRIKTRMDDGCPCGLTLHLHRSPSPLLDPNLPPALALLQDPADRALGKNLSDGAATLCHRNGPAGAIVDQQVRVDAQALINRGADKIGRACVGKECRERW